MTIIKGTVFDIQSFSVHDGPGIRTTFFLKGCPLRCGWCHNPEGILRHRQLQYVEQNCILCGKCVAVCKNKCHKIDGESHTVLFNKCNYCFSCEAVCPSKALGFFGMVITAEDVIRYAKKDAGFYGETGGVTFSGGEATAQPEFLLQALIACKKEGYTTAVDTSGYCDFRVLQRILPYTDLFLYDIKAYSDTIHVAGTGVSNANILDNIEKLQQLNARIWVRVPLIPNFNATIQEATLIAEFLQKQEKIEQVQLMPYHVLGRNKYQQIGALYPCEGLQTLTNGELAQITDVFKQHNLPLKQ